MALDCWFRDQLSRLLYAVLDAKLSGIRWTAQTESYCKGVVDAIVAIAIAVGVDPYGIRDYAMRMVPWQIEEPKEEPHE